MERCRRQTLTTHGTEAPFPWAFSPRTPQVRHGGVDACSVNLAAKQVDQRIPEPDFEGLTAIFKPATTGSSGSYRDPLTGLALRNDFQRLVNQRHIERERLGVVFIRISSLEQINNTLGLTTGDDILELVGDTLMDLQSSAVRAYRVGGSTFATAVEGRRLDNDAWAEDIVQAVHAATSALETPPRLHVGAASGFGDTVVEVAEQQLADRRRAESQASIEALGLDLTTSQTDWDVVPVVGAASKWRWVRPHTGNCSDIWGLLDDIAERLQDERAAARYSVPASDLARSDRSIAQRLFPRLERLRLPPRRLAFELDAAMFDPIVTGDDLARASHFAREACAIGATVVITEYAGEPSVWGRLPTAHIGYVRPSRELLLRAITDSEPNQSIEMMARASASLNIELIAPYPVRDADNGRSVESLIGQRELLALGFSYVEQPSDD